MHFSLFPSLALGFIIPVSLLLLLPGGGATFVGPLPSCYVNLCNV